MHPLTLIALFSITIVCDGQLLQYFGLGGEHYLVENPLVQSINTFAGETISSALGFLSKGPVDLARYLGFIGSLPLIAKPDNVNNILEDFEIGSSNEDVNLHITDLITKHGYPVESYEVETNDNYLLTMHRIPKDGPIVFLMHGLLGSSDDYVIAGRDSGFAYLFSDAGYDVWLGNARGNRHSRSHRFISTYDPDFWEFSWHEIGIYDLPCMIDFVLNNTGQSMLKYVGFSQGTTVFYVMASERPEYNSKISLMVSLSPVAWMSNVKSPFVRLAASGGPFEYAAAKLFGLNEFLPHNAVISSLTKLICGAGQISELMCSNILFLIVGFDFEQLNATNLPVIFGHLPAGASSKQLAHYFQGLVSGDFKQFDYGPGGNLRHYGAKVPPSYQVERITSPVSLFYSDADWLSHPTDVGVLYSKLSNAVDIYKVPFGKWNHLDFVWAKDVKRFIFDRMIKLFKLF